jgi:hypothetical protein
VRPFFCRQAGEVVEFLADEGSPVEYKQPVLIISPYFGEPGRRVRGRVAASAAS